MFISVFASILAPFQCNLHPNGRHLACILLVSDGGSSSSSQSQVCSRRCWCCHEKMIYNTVWVYVMFGEGLCKKGLRAPVHAVVKFGHAKGFSRPKHVHFRHEGLTLQEYDSVFCSGKDGSVGLGLGDCSVSPPSRLRFGSTTCCFFSLRLGAFLNKSVCVCAN